MINLRQLPEIFVYRQLYRNYQYIKAALTLFLYGQKATIVALEQIWDDKEAEKCDLFVYLSNLMTIII